MRVVFPIIYFMALFPITATAGDYCTSLYIAQLSQPGSAAVNIGKAGQVQAECQENQRLREQGYNVPQYIPPRDAPPQEQPQNMQPAMPVFTQPATHCVTRRNMFGNLVTNCN
jgi:hypothetical protein